MLFAPANCSFDNGKRGDSSVGKATRYVLDDPEVQSQWGRGIPHPSTPALGPTQPPVSFQRKAAGLWR